MPLPTVVLPQPDSPTSASVRPGRIASDTPSTARTCPTVRLKMPRRIGKWTFRSRTSSSGRDCSDALAPPISPGAGAIRDRSSTFRFAQMAADEMALGNARPARRLGAAPVERVLAAIGEAAAGELARERRHLAGDHLELRAPLAGRRQRGEELARVRMLRRAEESIARRDLDDLPGVHDRHAVRHAGDDAEIVGDQQDRHPALRLQLAQEVEHLRLDGDVERGRRLVGDRGGRARRRARARSSPAASSRRRAGMGTRRRGARCRRCRPRRAARSPARARAAPRMPACRVEHLGDLRPDREHRIQARRRLLEDHRHAPPAHVAHARSREARADRCRPARTLPATIAAGFGQEAHAA